jgi:L-2-hydroxyglutarate oxidase LhgO
MYSRVECDVAVVGGGIVGLATAYKIAQRYPALTVCVLEKESTLAFHQTGHNSGVIHSGLYYRPGSVKAKTCAAGRRELTEFARRYGIPFEICGKVIVATEERELPHMERIFRNAVENGIEGVEKIDAQRIKQLEPACQGLAGLHVPVTGIIDFTKVATALADCVRAANSDNQILTNREVVDLAVDGLHTVVTTRAGEVRTRLLINCAGLNSDRIAKLGGFAPNVRIMPFLVD